MGCSSNSKQSSQVTDNGKHKEYKNHFIPMTIEKKLDRQLAEESLKSADLNLLRKPGFKSFKVFVYPKLSLLAMKSNIKENSNLGFAKLKEYQVTTNPVQKCKTLLNPNTKNYASYNLKSVFDLKLADTEKNCAVVQVKDLQYANLNADLIKKGDLLSMSLFIDEDWRVYGYNVQEFTGEYKKTVTKNIKLDSNYNMSSGLTRFPVDLPILSMNPDLISIENVNSKEVIDSKNIQLKLPEIANCKAVKINFRDYFGQQVETTKCENSPWPAVIENSKFVAITQNLTTSK